jgi:hypothetical protein
MITLTTLAALLEVRLGRSASRMPHVRGLDAQARRDIGLPAAEGRTLPVLYGSWL